MPKKKKNLKPLISMLNVYTVIGVILIIIATFLFMTPTFPYLWYRINSGATDQEASIILAPTETNADSDISFTPPEEAPPEETVQLPSFDSSLSATNTLIIPNIGVNGQIHEGINASDMLDKGVWRVNSFGTPEDFTAIILAAHRFGYVYWSNDFRTTNSFYNLPKTKVGDKVEIIWGQRKYEYEIYHAEDSTGIQDYDADLILYTCRLFNSPVRIFRYANRVN